MNKVRRMTQICAAAAAVFSAAAARAYDPALPSNAEATSGLPGASIERSAPRRPVLPSPVAVVIPKPETAGAVAATTNAGFATTSALSALTVSPAGPATVLTPPVTISYSGSSPTILLTDSGTNKGIESLVTNTGNETSALYGSTAGSGAGLTGYNTGTGGPAGKFYVTNSNSAQAGVYATTDGTGSAVSGVITNTSSTTAAIYGQSTAASNGNGVEGSGSAAGVYGYSQAGTGVVGVGLTGVYALDNGDSGGVGLYAGSDKNIAVWAYLGKGVAGKNSAALLAQDDPRRALTVTGSMPILPRTLRSTASATTSRHASKAGGLALAPVVTPAVRAGTARATRT
jgi:hypothetical protein